MFVKINLNTIFVKVLSFFNYVRNMMTAIDLAVFVINAIRVSKQEKLTSLKDKIISICLFYLETTKNNNQPEAPLIFRGSSGSSNRFVSVESSNNDGRLLAGIILESIGIFSFNFF